MISIGSPAPAWSAAAYKNGEMISLSSDDFKGKWVLIYWWPFDFTGICHSEILGFQSLEADFAEIGVELLGASCDTKFAHEKWFSDTGAFPNGQPGHAMLADNTHKMTQDFGFYFEPAGCAVRGTVLIDPDGIVRSMGANFLNVARDPQDALITARAFAAGGACALPDRK
jgi:peroxiredoxin (alkyl hydroperoxide reductase subunit C)